MDRAALVNIGERVRFALAPLQLGVDVPYGCEIEARISQLATQARQADNLVPLSIEIKNACNTMVSLTGLREFEPVLRPHQGEHFADVSTGGKQGDLLSSLCFAVVLHDVLRQVQSVIAEPIDSESCIYSFVDDTNIICDARIANRVAVAVRTVFKTCKFLVRSNTILPVEGLNHFEVERNITASSSS